MVESGGVYCIGLLCCWLEGCWAAGVEGCILHRLVVLAELARSECGRWCSAAWHHFLTTFIAGPGL